MRPSCLSLALSLASGLAVGVFGPLLEASGNPVGHVASVVLVAGWMYALLAFGVGWAARSKVGAALRAWVVLVVAVVSYYVTKAVLGDFRVPDFNDPADGAVVFGWNEFLSMIGVWCVFAAVLGPLCGLAGYLSRTGSGSLRPLLRLPPRLLVPALVIVETTMRLAYESDTGPDAPVVCAVWTVTRALAAAVALVVAGTALVADLNSRSAGVRPHHSD
ncbi:hypothetical protein AB0O91_36260 [Kitasatospora sp. NPDC089797]|uniref:hypothetical protein n=1 Tax=Kitasatospora sp. NPDC089797 TaxID=3155298 RepID=UPI0034310413